jgi:hypothetical protein
MSGHAKAAAESDSSVNWRTGLLAERASNGNGDHASVDDQIRLRAYELYMERGAQPNNDLEDWLRAERELTEAARAEEPGGVAS